MLNHYYLILVCSRPQRIIRFYPAVGEVGFIMGWGVVINPPGSRGSPGYRMTLSQPKEEGRKTQGAQWGIMYRSCQGLLRRLVEGPLHNRTAANQECIKAARPARPLCPKQRETAGWQRVAFDRRADVAAVYILFQAL